MKKLNQLSILFLMLFTLFIFSCSENVPEPPLSTGNSDDGVSNLANDHDRSNAARLAFTGRDSILGFAFKTWASGNVIFKDNEIDMKGEGRATHMGNIDIFRSHSIAEFTGRDSIIGGEFIYVVANTSDDDVIIESRKKQDKVSGTYKGVIEEHPDGSFSFEIREEIDTGTGHFEGVIGVLTTIGQINSNGKFSYTSDGWMLNTHANKFNALNNKANENALKAQND